MKRLIVAALCLAFVIQTAHAITFTDPGFVDTTLWSGLSSPISLRFASDGRVFVAQRTGQIYTYDNASDQTKTLFATIDPAFINTTGEMGLIGMAVDPRWPAQPYVYVLYVLKGGNPGGRLARIPATGANLEVGGAEQVLLDGWCQPWDAHTVDDLEFGPDGALYVSAGDGADYRKEDYGQDGRLCDANKTYFGGSLRSQLLNESNGTPILSAKILRLDPDTGVALADNPLAGSAAERIIAHGLRNPFRFTIDPRNGDLYVGDNGYNSYEEINYIPNPLTAPILNFGWPCFEGFAPTPRNLNTPSSAFSTNTNITICQALYAQDTTTKPWYVYNHTVGNSVGGIQLLSGAAFPPAYEGSLIATDNIKGFWTLFPPDVSGKPDAAAATTFATGASFAVDLTQGPDGLLYYVDYVQGKVHRISYPQVQVSATPSSGVPPLAVQFSATAQLAGTIVSYNWDLDGDGVFGDATGPQVNYTYTVGGVYTVRVNVTDDAGTSAVASTTVQANAPPTPVIDTPDASVQYAAGGLVFFSGSATDPETGVLPASALTWTWGRNDCADGPCHFEVLGQIQGVPNGTFPGDDEAPNSMVLTLTADDSGFGPASNATGLSASVNVTLQPQLSTITVHTDPEGFTVQTLGEFGADFVTPANFTGVVDAPLSVSAPALVYNPVDFITYAFVNWSDGLPAVHDVVFSAQATDVTALYEPFVVPNATLVVNATFPNTTVTVSTVTNGSGGGGGGGSAQQTDATGIAVFADLLPAAYRVDAWVPNYQVTPQTVNLTANQTLAISLALNPLNGTFNFTLDPQDATVVIGNQSVSSVLYEGETQPFTLNLYDYLVTVLIISNTNESAKFIVNGVVSPSLQANQTWTLSDGAELTLWQTIPAGAYRETDPADSANFTLHVPQRAGVNGTLSVPAVVPGQYDILVAASAYAPYTATVLVSPNQTVPLPVTLAPLNATLSVQATPSAAVSINGVSYGATPFSVSLAPGTYTVLYQANGWQDVSHMILLGANESLTDIVNLEPAVTTTSRRGGGGGGGGGAVRRVAQQSNTTEPEGKEHGQSGTPTQSSSSSVVAEEAAAACEPAWSCEEWSSCTDGVQTRSCQDENACDPNAAAVVQSQTCESSAASVLTGAVLGGGVVSWLFAAGALALIGGALAFVLVRRFRAR